MSKVSDLLNSPMWPTRQMVRVNATEEMSIVPANENSNEPLLKIEQKDEYGNLCSCVTMNLAAVDDRIGKLIKMRDLLEGLKER